MNGTLLDVPALEREAAAAKGARWHEGYYSWYAPPDRDLESFRRWFRVAGAPRLASELVPSTCWCSNVRSHMPREDWAALSRLVYRAANYKCETCGCQGSAHPVENHEVWRYEAGVQTLTRLIALCPACHLCKHPGFAEVNGRTAEVYAQLMRVNGWQRAQVAAHLKEVFARWELQSKKTWGLDLSYLERMFGIRLQVRR